MTVLITLTLAGTDSGPFNLYSDIDGYVSAFETNVAKIDLLGGYSSALVPDGTSSIRILSTSTLCSNYIDATLTTTTTTTSTLPPDCTCSTLGFTAAADSVIRYWTCTGTKTTLSVPSGESVAAICCRTTPGIIILSGDGDIIDDGICGSWC
jgi:hypothetical protein